MIAERASAGPLSARRLSVLPFGTILIGANLRAPITVLGPVLSEVQGSLHLSDTAAGTLNALPLLIFALLSLAAPSAGRRFGLERVLGGAVAAILVGTLARSLLLPGSIWWGTVLLSSGIAFGNVLLPGLVKRDFPTNAAGMIGLYAAAMAGAAGVAAGLAVPIAHLSGSSWRWALGCWSMLSFITLLAWLPQLTGPQHRLVSNGPSYAPAVSPWKHRIGWQVSLFFLLHSLVFYSIVDWFSSYASLTGMPSSLAGVYLLVYQVVAIATNLGCAPFIRRLPDQRMLGLACGILLVVGTGGLLLAPQLAIIWLISGGLGAGIAMVTSLSLFALRTVDHHQASQLSSMAQFVGYMGAAAGPLLVGVLHEVSHGWILPFSLLIASAALVTVFATLAGRARTIGYGIAMDIPVNQAAPMRLEKPSERVRVAIRQISSGGGVIVVDDEDRENEGDMIFAAHSLTVEQMALMIREGSGVVCLVPTDGQARALDLPPMVDKNSSRFGTGFTVSIEARDGVSSGVSAADRVTTILAAIAPGAKPDHLARPGHVFPLVAHPRGLAARQGHTEATIALMQMAGVPAAGVLCEVTNPDGSMARLPDLVLFARQHGMPVITIAALRQAFAENGHSSFSAASVG